MPADFEHCCHVARKRKSHRSDLQMHQLGPKPAGSIKLQYHERVSIQMFPVHILQTACNRDKAPLLSPTQPTNVRMK